MGSRSTATNVPGCEQVGSGTLAIQGCQHLRFFPASERNVNAKIKNMRPRILRLLALLWLGWYLAGPVCEAVDTWDSPKEELQDVIFHAGGALTVIAAAFCSARVLSRRFRQLHEVLAHRARIHLVAILALKPQAFVPVASLLADNPPPLPLRI
jgi:hypothetical protein